jgi:TonB family protein
VPETRPEPAPAPRRAVGESAAAPTLPAAGESKRSRAGLVAGIGIAAVALVAGGLFLTKGSWSGAKPPVVPTAPKTEPATANTLSAASSAPSPALPVAEAAKVVDPKAVEAEVRRVAAEREKALREAAAKQPATAGKPATVSAQAPAVVGLAPVRPAEPPRAIEAPVPTPKPAEVVVEPTARPAPPPPPLPTEVSVPDNQPVIPAVSSAPVKVGDLVGPGEGVVEPRLVHVGPMSTLPPQARQIRRGADGSIGTTILTALVDERGAVQEIRILRPSSYKFVDEAAIHSLKNATILPATKDGVKVKMWKSFPITVKP